MSKPHHSRYMTCSFALILIMLSIKPFCNLSTGEFLCNHPIGDFVGANASIWLRDIDGLTMVYCKSCPGQFLSKIFRFILNNLYPIPSPLYKFQYPCEWPESHPRSICREYNRPLTIIIDSSGSVLITADGYFFRWITAWILWQQPGYFEHNTVAPWTPILYYKIWCNF